MAAQQNAETLAEATACLERLDTPPEAVEHFVAFAAFLGGARGAHARLHAQWEHVQVTHHHITTTTFSSTTSTSTSSTIITTSFGARAGDA